MICHKLQAIQMMRVTSEATDGRATKTRGGEI
jgi:hypothetical protein